MPKGVALKHKSMLNNLYWRNREYKIEATDTLLQKTNYTFDVSVWELFLWILSGSKLSILKPEDEKDPKQIIEAIEKEKVTMVHFVPSMFDVFLDYLLNHEDESNRLSSLKQIITSG